MKLNEAGAPQILDLFSPHTIQFLFWSIDSCLCIMIAADRCTTDLLSELRCQRKERKLCHCCFKWVLFSEGCTLNEKLSEDGSAVTSELLRFTAGSPGRERKSVGRGSALLKRCSCSSQEEGNSYYCSIRRELLTPSPTQNRYYAIVDKREMVKSSRLIISVKM